MKQERGKNSWRAMMPPKDLEMSQEHLDEFWKFVFERHEIYHKRFVLKQPPPWTDNPWLRAYKFTNVYREIDRGTIWLKNHVLDKFAGDDRELLFQITVYRLLNRVETFESVGGVPTLKDYDRKKFRDALFVLRDAGERVFTSAHLTCPTHTAGRAKIDEYLIAIDDMLTKFNSIFDEIKAAPSLKEVFQALNRIHCVGAFIAYEVCIDLMTSGVVPFDEDNWVNAGPGAKVGIDLIFPNRKLTSYEAAIHKLRWSQKDHFKRLGLDFHYLNGKELTLRNIEHSLCEFAKMTKLSWGMGKARMKFVPTTDTGHDLIARISSEYKDSQETQVRP